MLRSIKKILRIVSAITTLAAIIATPILGYLWFAGDPANPEAMYYFFASLFSLAAGGFGWLYNVAPSEEDLARWDEEHTDQRVNFAHIADGIKQEIDNFEKLASGKKCSTLEWKAVAHNSFECMKEGAEQLPRELRFRFLVAAIANEANRQLQITDWASRSPHKILRLARKLLARVQPLAATEQELLEHR